MSTSPPDAPLTESPDDRALLAAHVAGDDEAFGILFGRHRDRLWAVALRTTGDPEEAADALQDALIAAFRRADTFRGEAAVTTWLHRIVVNACLDRMRRRKTRQARPLPDELEELGSRGSLSTAAVGADPHAAAEQAERVTAVRRALATLPEEQRVPLVLVDLEGVSVAEVAELLGVPTGTVKSRCSRGRTRLAALLVAHAPGNQPDDPDVPPWRGALGKGPEVTRQTGGGEPA